MFVLIVSVDGLSLVDKILLIRHIISLKTAAHCLDGRNVAFIHFSVVSNVRHLNSNSNVYTIYRGHRLKISFFFFVPLDGEFTSKTPH